MDKIITLSESKYIDKLSIEEYKIPSLVLMESAARELYYAIKEYIKLDDEICIVAGCGNNGADALALARILFCDSYKNISIYYLDGEESNERRIQREACEALNIKRTDDVGKNIVIDGLLGVGIKGSVREKQREIIKKINCAKRVFSIDIPSGMSETSEFCVKAELTLTFAYEKIDFYTNDNLSSCGKIIVINPSFPLDKINISSRYYKLSLNDLSLRKINNDRYKNQKGHICLVGGSKEYSGAIRLSAKACFKSGAGLVTIYTSPDILSLVQSENISSIVKSYDDFTDNSSYTSYLIGPGGSFDDNIVIDVIKSAKSKVCVIDAAALDSICKKKDELPIECNLILTPHVGEFKRVCKILNVDSNNIFDALKEVSLILRNCQIVLKSSITIIYKESKYYIYDGRNRALGVAGSGDVLSGCIVTLNDAIEGVLFHSKAGYFALAKYGIFDSDELVGVLGEIR